MAADYLRRSFISHTRRVCSLYKRMSRECDYREEDLLEARYNKLVLRREFEKNRNIKDMRKAHALLEEAEVNFMKNMHPYHAHGQPFHPYSKEGIAYERNMVSPDYVMDGYHPLEKAQYPYYYAKREQMKQDYINMWKKKLMKPGEGESKLRS